MFYHLVLFSCSHGTNSSEFICKDAWPPNSLDVSSLDYYIWGSMLECYKTFHHKLKNNDTLKKVLQLIAVQLLQDSANKAIHKDFECV